jgi:hypothetical protein
MAASNYDWKSVGESFAKHYFTTMDGNRASIGALFQAASMFQMENEQMTGAEAIVAKVSGMFQSIAHQVKTVDCQPSGGGGVLVVVCGDVAVNGQAPVKFNQSFHVMPTDATNSNFYIHNSTFRFN